MTIKDAFLILLNFTRFMIQQLHLYIGHAEDAAGGSVLEKKVFLKIAVLKGKISSKIYEKYLCRSSVLV